MGGVCQADARTSPAESEILEDAKPLALRNAAGLTNYAGPALCKNGCGCRVQEGLTKSGQPYTTCCRSCALNPSAGVHDKTCRGPPEGEIALSSAVRYRPVCPDGAHCRRRTPEHLAACAHPLDKDYRQCCVAAGVTPEEPSLKILFDWADADGSGKLTKAELSATLHLINALSGDDEADEDDGSLEISAEAWKRLDEDGNGLVNFNEFAAWAGPRLGLPLGVKKLIERSGSACVMTRPCGVLGCPCEDCEGDGMYCTRCKHKSSAHMCRKAAAGEIPCPDYWTNSGAGVHVMVDMKGLASEEFQQLLNMTYKKTWTRDRSRHNEIKDVPKGFQVTSVKRNENCDNWAEFCVRRAELMTRVQDGVQEIDQIADVKTTVAWKDIKGGAMANRLAKECNEWYLFHGTSPEAAQAICSSDFKIRFAGANTGTLYGRGLYFAESITKSDEYAKPNAQGRYAVLMCRILGGSVRYTDEVSPDVEQLVENVIEGPYDTILGDREKCRGTYREFVIFDTEDVYPEYLIEYERIY